MRRPVSRDVRSEREESFRATYELQCFACGTSLTASRKGASRETAEAEEGVGAVWLPRLKRRGVFRRARGRDRRPPRTRGLARRGGLEGEGRQSARDKLDVWLQRQGRTPWFAAESDGRDVLAPVRVRRYVRAVQSRCAGDEPGTLTRRWKGGGPKRLPAGRAGMARDHALLAEGNLWSGTP
ncbi:unnamed protein product, partial [Ilex paraguariensis]